MTSVFRPHVFLSFCEVSRTRRGSAAHLYELTPVVLAVRVVLMDLDNFVRMIYDDIQQKNANTIFPMNY